MLTSQPICASQKALARINARFAAHTQLIDPESYFDMILIEDNARLIATDSGRARHKAYFLGILCLALRSAEAPDGEIPLRGHSQCGDHRWPQETGTVIAKIPTKPNRRRSLRLAIAAGITAIPFPSTGPHPAPRLTPTWQIAALCIEACLCGSAVIKKTPTTEPLASIQMGTPNVRAIDAQTRSPGKHVNQGAQRDARNAHCKHAKCKHVAPRIHLDLLANALVGDPRVAGRSEYARCAERTVRSQRRHDREPSNENGPNPTPEQSSAVCQPRKLARDSERHTHPDRHERQYDQDRLEKPPYAPCYAILLHVLLLSRQTCQNAAASSDSKKSLLRSVSHAP